jgi:hypothetical protein
MNLACDFSDMSLNPNMQSVAEAGRALIGVLVVALRCNNSTDA